MVAAYEFMYLTPGIQNLVRENKVFRIDSEIQTGKKFGMVLLDDFLYTLFQQGKISKEEAIDKSKNPNFMAEKLRRGGADVGEELEELGGEDAAAKPPAGPGSAPPVAAAMSEADRQAQMAKNRARMMGQKPE
jgi:hypothetical protein